MTVCGLQKSQWDRSYYVNVGFNFVTLDGDPHPHAEDCHLTVRIGELIPDDAEVRALDGLLDLEISFADSAREALLFETFTRRLGPVVVRSATVEGLRGLLADGTLPEYALTLRAREVMGVPLRAEDAEV